MSARRIGRRYRALVERGDTIEITIGDLAVQTAHVIGLRVGAVTYLMPVGTALARVNRSEPSIRLAVGRAELAAALLDGGEPEQAEGGAP